MSKMKVKHIIVICMISIVSLFALPGCTCIPFTCAGNAFGCVTGNLCGGCLSGCAGGCASGANS